jgi:hypothetical protein
MNVPDHIRENLVKLASLGLQEREDARKAGVSSFYVDPAFGDYIVEEQPNGVKILTPITPERHRSEAAE